MKLVLWLTFAVVLYFLWTNVPKGAELAYLPLFWLSLLWGWVGKVLFVAWARARAMSTAMRKAGVRAIKKGDQDVA